jgi:hypothetical protein
VEVKEEKAEKINMEIPVTGLIIHADDSNSESEHSHHLYMNT